MIGYYVHHQGAGHAMRFSALYRASDEPIVGLGSGPCPRGVAPDHWVELPSDLVEHPRNATVNGALHWAPYGSAMAERTSVIAAWIAQAGPRVIVVDVSVEVALTARLCGVPVASLAQHGARDDAAHLLGDWISDMLVAPYPAWAAPRPHHALVCTGAISRFDGRSRDPHARRARSAVLLVGAGGRVFSDADVAEAAAAIRSDGWEFTVLGLGEPSDEDAVWAALTRASVAVCTAGNNVLAEVAAARLPAIVLPQPRPFAEQERHLAALEGFAPCVAVTSAWPVSDQWPDLLARAQSLDGDGWREYNDGAGAKRMLAAVSACG